MRRCTFLRKLEDVERHCSSIIDRFKELDRKATNLITKEEIVELFEKDANSIKESYERGEISRKEAQQLLQDLHRVADELERYISHIREIFLKLEEDSRSILRKLIEPPQFGVPVTVVKGEIKRLINQILGEDIPKREFGVLEVSNLSESGCRQKIHEFINEYSSGLVITQPELSECLTKILNDAHVRFEVKKVGVKIIFMVEGQK